MADNRYGEYGRDENWRERGTYGEREERGGDQDRYARAGERRSFSDYGEGGRDVRGGAYGEGAYGGGRTLAGASRGEYGEGAAGGYGRNYGGGAGGGGEGPGGGYGDDYGAGYRGMGGGYGQGYGGQGREDYRAGYRGGGREQDYEDRGYGRGYGAYAQGAGYGQQGGGRGQERRGEDRNFIEKAGDRMQSWFGGEEQERGEHRGRGPKGYRRSDERIQEDVSDRLSDDPRLDASEIEVRAENGDVILSGTVHSREDKRRAEMLAEGCSGVQNVLNNIRVQQQSGREGGLSAQTGRNEPVTRTTDGNT